MHGIIPDWMFQLKAACMEAEQLNQIENTLSGLKDRTAQLRRYL
jgi:hypothetical protein